MKRLKRLGLILGIAAAVLLTAIALTATAGAATTYTAEGFKYTLSSSSRATITGLSNTSYSGALELPSTLNGYKVSYIGDYAFRDCTGITSITIPASVKTIYPSAFSGCTGLRTVAFKEGSLLQDIYSGAFSGCTSLESIAIPENVSVLNYNAFYGCTGLESITVAEGNIKYLSSGNCVIERSAKTLLLGCKNSVIPTDGSVEIIGDSAFMDCTGLESITIPAGVTNIRNCAFYGCAGLKSITIPASVTNISYNAFYRCTGLESITVDEGNTVYLSSGNCLIEISTKTLLLGCKNSVIPSDESVEIIAGDAFYYCTGLESITVPANVVDIGKSAFYYCTGLKTVTFEEGSLLESIGSNAFSYCRGLESVTIPANVTSIGSNAFNDCTGLKTVTFEGGSLLETIGPYVFYDCTNLESVSIPASVTSIDSDAFKNCTGLKEVHISDISAWCNINFPDGSSNPLIRAKKLYLNGMLVTDLVIPANVENICDNAFSHCTGLESITITANVTSIGEFAFYGCTGLKTITFEEGSLLESIGDYAFWLCTGLESVTIPANVTDIGNSAFSSCSNLNSVVIPASVTYIGNGAFSGCPSLTMYVYEGSYAHTYAIDNAIDYELITGHDYDANCICAYCGGVFKVSSATLSLGQDIGVKFLVKEEILWGYDYSRLEVTFKGHSYTVTGVPYEMEGEAYIAFAFRDINPSLMDEDISAVLQASKDGEDWISAEEKHYSVATYCYNMLGKESTSAGLKTTIVDLLNFGAALQAYLGQTEGLVNARLTPDQQLLGTQATPDLVDSLSIAPSEESLVTWKGAILNFNSSISPKIYFVPKAGVDVSTLTAEISCNGRSWTVTDFDSTEVSGETRYIVTVSGMNIIDLAESFTVRMTDGAEYSQVLTYSVETFAQRKQNDANEKLGNMVICMMKFISAANSYFEN